MPTLDEMLVGHGVHGDDADHVHRLVADWQLLADLSFADLLLCLPVGGGIAATDWIVAAQIRPTTGPTAHQDDLVGATVSAQRAAQLSLAALERRIVREGDPVWAADIPRREEAIPVVRRGHAVAVVARDTNLSAARTPSRLEIAYLQSAADLATMLAEGTWPSGSDAAEHDAAGPRVGDGFVRVEADGTVAFASPNALSAFRRLGHTGDLVGLRLTGLLTALGLDPPALGGLGGEGWLAGAADIEGPDAVVALRTIPVRRGGERIGAVVLVRDVTELRRRERLLVSKDATIREIHHRVKNNLQTVAALLRLQARRLEGPEGRAALEESVRRVTSIALVHETLSGTLDETVDFDAIADRVLALAGEMGAGRVAVRRTGSFGVLASEVATPLAMVLTELVQNAVEHGYPDLDSTGGRVVVHAERAATRLVVEVGDGGRGLPTGFDVAASDRLGLQIVRTLVTGELGGELSIAPGEGGGTCATVTVPLR